MDGFNSALTIAERLKKAGYATCQSGKWHLGPESEITDHGFDHFFAKDINNPRLANIDIEGNDISAQLYETPMYHIDACSAVACSFIKRYQKQPFFLYLAYRAPHVPLDAPEKYLKRIPNVTPSGEKIKMPHRRRQALAMLSAVDDGVGSVLTTLRECGIEEKTLIFFIGDNGAPLKILKLDAPGGGAGWDGSLNDPLNGEKGMLAEGGIRTPFVVYWKSKIPGGQVFDHPVISLDAAATAVAAAGLPHDPVLDGVDLVPYLTGENQGAPHEFLFWRWLHQAAVRKGKWKYLCGVGKTYLFDLESDREEKHNLIEKHPEIATALRADLDKWAQTLTPPGIGTMQSSGMERATQQWFSFYLDGKPLTPAEIASMKEKWGMSGQNSKNQMPPNPKLFRQRDANNDGVVTWEEYLKGRAGPSVKTIRRAFDERDKNGDGQWAKDEI
jgi:uncharacterized sulfatase